MSAALEAGVALPAASARLGPAVDALVAERALVVPVHGVDDLADAVVVATADIEEAATPAPLRSATSPIATGRAPRVGAGDARGPGRRDVRRRRRVALVESRLHADGARFDDARRLGGPAAG